MIIAFHGNADLSVRMIGWAQDIVMRTGVPVLLAEYRGYMGIEGRPTYDGVGRDAEAAFAFAGDSLHANPGQLAFFGHSLGSAVASELAARRASIMASAAGLLAPG